jgi:hypothetical protein
VPLKGSKQAKVSTLYSLAKMAGRNFATEFLNRRNIFILVCELGMMISFVGEKQTADDDVGVLFIIILLTISLFPLSINYFAFVLIRFIISR